MDLRRYGSPVFFIEREEVANRGRETRTTREYALVVKLKHFYDAHKVQKDRKRSFSSE